MNFNHLYYFKVLAGFQHYTKAAEYLCITQPTLSHVISSLESEYNIKLFEKDGRNVKLSKYGKILNSYVSKGFSELEHADYMLRQFARKEAGFIDFSFLFVLGHQFVPELIRSFYASGTFHNITISLKQYKTNNSILGLKDGDIDISLCAYLPAEPSISFIPILKQELICIVSENHPLAILESVDINELLCYPIIKYNDNVGEIQNIINKLFEESGSNPVTHDSLEEEITIAGFVSSGINNCIAIVPDLEILDGFKIKKLRLNHPDAYRIIYLATSKNQSMPNCVKLFYEFIKDNYQIELPQ